MHRPREAEGAVEIVVDNLVDIPPSQRGLTGVAFAADAHHFIGSHQGIARPEQIPPHNIGGTLAMSDSSPTPSARSPQRVPARAAPPADVVEFIRFCHRRRHVGWPEIYDEMWAVAARREFNGWDHDQLAEHGVTFALYEMPKLAGWVRAVLGAQPMGDEADLRPIVRQAVGPA